MSIEARFPAARPVPVTRTVRVAAIQLASRLGDVEATLQHAEPLVARAAAGGARLVVLPELFSTGYLPNRDLWAHVEGRSGPTARWLSELAHRFEIHLGGGFAAWSGSDALNLFALAGPDGRIVGTARKRNAESYLFRRGRGLHVVETALGRIGVGICADCQSSRVLRIMRDHAVDLVLMPHASPTAALARGAVSQADIAAQRERAAELPLTYARGLGVPAVFVNQTGAMAPMSGILGRLMDPALFRLQGGSRIVDSDGSLVGSLGDGEDVLIGDVTLDPARRASVTPPSYAGWLTPGNPIVRRVLIPLDVAIGGASYRLRQRARRAAARAAADRGMTGQTSAR